MNKKQNEIKSTVSKAMNDEQIKHKRFENEGEEQLVPDSPDGDLQSRGQILRHKLTVAALVVVCHVFSWQAGLCNNNITVSFSAHCLKHVELQQVAIMAPTALPSSKIPSSPWNQFYIGKSST